MAFYDILHQLMVEKHATAKQLSEKLSIGKNQFKYWKDKGNIPNGEALMALADYFDCSVDYLLGRTDERQGHTSPTASGSDITKQRLLNNYDTLNDTGKDKLTNYSDDLCGNPAYTS